jgi:hypothetical protein
MWFGREKSVKTTDGRPTDIVSDRSYRQTRRDDRVGRGAVRCLCVASELVRGSELLIIFHGRFVLRQQVFFMFVYQALRGGTVHAQEGRKVTPQLLPRARFEQSRPPRPPRPAQCSTPRSSSLKKGRWPKSGWRRTGTRSSPRFSAL